MNPVTILAVVAVGLCLATLLAVRRGWLSRLEHGFLVTLILALTGIGLATAALFGVWGQEVARRALFQQTLDSLASIGGIVEAEVARELQSALSELEKLAKLITPEQARKDPKYVEERLRDIQRFNTELLQVSLQDRDGALLVSSSRSDVAEPASRVAIAFNLEGKPFISDPYFSPRSRKYELYMSIPVRGPDQAVTGALGIRYDMHDEFAGLVTGARFGRTGHTALTDSGGRLLAHADLARLNDDLSAYAAVQRALQGQSGWLIATTKAGQDHLMVYRPLKNPSTLTQKPWALLTEMHADEALAPVRNLASQFAMGIAAIALACLALAHQLSRSVSRPLHELLPFIRRVRQGELTGSPAAECKDEIGQLGLALNDMVRGLQERDRVKDVFGRYVTTQISEKVLKGEVNLGGQLQRVTILFSDIRNFTAMSETMAPEQIVSFLNDYFTEMVEAVFEHGGVLDKFIGDGIMAVFGALGDGPDHARRAVRAGLRMKALLAKINGERTVAGKPPIAIGVGIHTDDAVVGNIGSRKRLQYTVVGDGVNTCSRVESANKTFGTTILITETTYAEVQDEFECRPMPEVELKGKLRVPQLYEVVSTRVPRDDAHAVRHT